MDFDAGLGFMKVLRVGINDNKIHSFNLSVKHPRYGVASPSADADNFYSGKCFYVWFNMRHEDKLFYQKFYRRSILTLYSNVGIIKTFFKVSILTCGKIFE